MRYSNRLNNLAGLDDVPRGPVVRNDAPAVLLRRGPAGNDAACEGPAIVTNDAKSWAQRALAANGFGGDATPDSPVPQWLASELLLEAARAHRSATLTAIIVSAIRTVGALARRVRRRYRQRQEAKAIYDALQELDDHTLHDLGLARSEISSVAAEATGQAPYTRAQTFAGITR